MRANILKEEQKKKAKRLADGSGDGPEGGGGMPARTAGAASDAPVAPEGTSAALRRFYK
jgi:U3 small nucleolar RNA-associated protein 7